MTLLTTLLLALLLYDISKLVFRTVLAVVLGTIDFFLSDSAH